MMASSAIDVDKIVAFDVHVHLEHTGEQTDADKHAAAYFKGGGARDAASLAEYYRSRNMACVIFTVDETLTGTPRLSNDEVVEFAQKNADIAIPFASINPTRGAEAVREAQDYTWNALRKGYRPGMGRFLPDRLFWARDESEALGEEEAEAARPADARDSH